LDEATFAAAWVSGEALQYDKAIAQALAFLLNPVDAGEVLPSLEKADSSATCPPPGRPRTQSSETVLHV
jgi:hypothetical protein